MFVKKLNDSRKLHRHDKWFHYYYEDVFFSFENQLPVCLKEYVNDENFLLAKEVLMNKLYYSILPFRVWNHLFLCERSQYLVDMSRYCTKLKIKNKKILEHMNKELYVQINEFPFRLSQGIVAA